MLNTLKMIIKIKAVTASSINERNIFFSFELKGFSMGLL